MSKAQIAFNVLCKSTQNTQLIARFQLTYLPAGIGQSGPLTLLVAAVQFSAPHAFLSTATGLAFSARAIGGAFGSAVLDAIINGYLTSHYASTIGSKAASLGVAASGIPDVVVALQAGNTTRLAGLGLDHQQIGQLVVSGEWVYAKAYRMAWASIVPFVVLALVAVAFLKGVKELMTEKVEASVEKEVVGLDHKLDNIEAR